MIKKRKFQKAFNTYVEAVRSGTVTVDTIEKLEKVLPELGSIQLSSEELGNLVGIFKDYTIKLAKDNGQEMDDDKPSETPIIDFKKYLEMQKRIIKTA